MYTFCDRSDLLLLLLLLGIFQSDAFREKGSVDRFSAKRTTLYSVALCVFCIIPFNFSMFEWVSTRFVNAKREVGHCRRTNGRTDERTYEWTSEASVCERVLCGMEMKRSGIIEWLTRRLTEWPLLGVFTQSIGMADHDIQFDEIYNGFHMQNGGACMVYSSDLLMDIL